MKTNILVGLHCKTEISNMIGREGIGLGKEMSSIALALSESNHKRGSNYILRKRLIVM